MQNAQLLKSAPKAESIKNNDEARVLLARDIWRATARDLCLRVAQGRITSGAKALALFNKEARKRLCNAFPGELPGDGVMEDYVLQEWEAVVRLSQRLHNNRDESHKEILPVFVCVHSQT